MKQQHEPSAISPKKKGHQRLQQFQGSLKQNITSNENLQF
jgi:hypothetical protein